MSSAAGCHTRVGWTVLVLVLAAAPATWSQSPMPPPMPPMPGPPIPAPAPAPGPVPVLSPAASQPEPAAGGPVGERDPFWPVGFSPAPPPSATDTNRSVVPPQVIEPLDPRQPPPEPDWASARTLLEVRGITRSASRVTALVNGSIVTPRDKVRVTRDGFVYEWDVVDITAEGLKLKQRNAVPVGRQE